MTAKSRRRKMNKRKKSDEYPQSRRTEAADGSTKGTGGRADISASHVVLDEAASLNEGPVLESGDKVITEATLKDVFLVPEGQGFPGSFIAPEDIDELIALHEVDPREIGIDPPQKGGKLYLNDHEFEAFIEVRSAYKERVRQASASDAAPSS